MAEKIVSDKDLNLVMNTLSSTGVFITCGLETPNVMVAHWGTAGKIWGRQVFTLPVRSTKYSFQIIEKTKSFAINVPARDMRSEISLCDTVSGFKVNKFETLNLMPKRAKKIQSYVLGECGLIVECRVIALIPPESVQKRVDDLFPSPRPHSLFIGEPVCSYRLH